MFQCLSRNAFPLLLNKKISDYCRNSTNESIRKLIERHNSEKEKPKFNFDINTSNENNNDNNNKNNHKEVSFINFIIFLSVSSIAFFLYKRIK